MSRPPKSVAISVRDRLTARAREHRENAQLLITRYIVEPCPFVWTSRSHSTANHRIVDWCTDSGQSMAILTLGWLFNTFDVR